MDPKKDKINVNQFISVFHRTFINNYYKFINLVVNYLLMDFHRDELSVKATDGS